MNEAGTWQAVKKLLVGLDAVRVENPVCPGTPDVNFTGGWIELKWRDCYPRDRAALLKVDHFTPQQRVWLIRRWRANKRAWLLFRIVDHWFIFTGEWAALNLGNKASYNDMLVNALVVWEGTPPRDEFIKIFA